MQCLFLDDDEFRHRNLDEMGHEVWHVRTAKEAIEKLKEREFDFVSLDHDLGGEVYVSSFKENTGYEVALFISKMKNPPRKIRIHSYNPVGASNMMKALAEVTLLCDLELWYSPYSGRLI